MLILRVHKVEGQPSRLYFQKNKPQGARSASIMAERSTMLRELIVHPQCWNDIRCLDVRGRWASSRCDVFFLVPWSRNAISSIRLSSVSMLVRVKVYILRLVRKKNVYFSKENERWLNLTNTLRTWSKKKIRCRKVYRK